MIRFAQVRLDIIVLEGYASPRATVIYASTGFEDRIREAFHFCQCLEVYLYHCAGTIGVRVLCTADP